MRPFMIALFNTSVVTGVCIFIFLLVFSLCGKRYGAKCRKIIWGLIAVCCLVPFRFPAVLPYSVDIPDVVIRRGDTDHAKQAVTQSGQAEPQQTTSAKGPETGNSVVSGVTRKEITATDVFFILWLCAGAALLFYYSAGFRKLKRTIRRLGYECTDSHIRKILQEEAERYRLKRTPRLWILRDSPMGPFTIGVLQNTIVLPEDVSDERDLRFILKHELLHCKQKDILWKLFFLFVNIIHWFNPFVWLLRKAAEQDIEICCDEAVVAGEGRTYREEYSDVIMSWVAKSSCKWSAASTGYVQGVKFIKRRFDSIINGRKKKGGFLIVAACAVLVLAGSLIHIQNGKKVYAVKQIPIDTGIEIRTDLDGDGTEDRVLVTDNVSGDYAFTQVLAKFQNGDIALIDYPDYWASYLVTGDLNSDGLPDIIVNRISTGSTYGGGETSILHVEKNDAGEPVLAEYPSNFIQNPDLEVKWVGWEDYDGEDIPDDDYSTAQPSGFGPENLDFHGMGANIFEKDGKMMLRFVSYVDPWTESVKCIECSYTPEGWYIEDMQIIYDYWGGDWEDKLMGEWWNTGTNEISEQSTQVSQEDAGYAYINDTVYKPAAEGSAEDSEETKESEEVQNLRQRMEDFCQAYFHGDMETVKEFLSASYSGDIDVYENPEEAASMDMRDITGLTDINGLSDTEKYTLSKPFIAPGEDSLTYLSVTFVNENGAWEVNGYGLEK